MAKMKPPPEVLGGNISALPKDFVRLLSYSAFGGTAAHLPGRSLAVFALKQLK